MAAAYLSRASRLLKQATRIPLQRISFSTMVNEHEHCTTGTIAVGEPVGSETVIAGRQTYVTGPESSEGKAILFLTDVFGMQFVNNRLLADTYAKGVNVRVYLPDLFDGKPAPAARMRGEKVEFDIQAFLAENSKEVRYPQITAVAKDLKAKYGVKSLGAAGFCYGAWACAQLSRDGLIDAFAVAHPSKLEIPYDIENIKTPTLFLCAETDHAFPPEKREASQKILEGGKYPTKFVLYPGVTHGFAVRGSEQDKDAAEKAAQEAISFYKSYL